MKHLIIVLAFLLALSPFSSSSFPFVPTTAPTYYDDMAALVVRFDALYDQIPESAFPQIHTQQELDLWVQEIVPFFAYEHIVSNDVDADMYSGMQYPRSVTFTYFDGARDQHHVLGRADCFSGDIMLNARMANPVSPFYARDVLSVLVHELAHVQGICWGNTRLDSENSAQLVTLEVLSAMTNKGNHAAFVSLVGMLRMLAIDAAEYAAMQENREEEFHTLETQVAQSAFELAMWNKSARYWMDDPEQLEYILYTYNFVPMHEAQQAVTNNHCFFTEYSLPADMTDPLVETRTRLDTPCIEGVQLPINMDVFGTPLVLDDLQYVWYHMEELIQDL